MMWQFCRRISPLLFIAFCFFARDNRFVLRVGDPLPVFSLTTPDGKVFKSEALKGRVLLLDFWATWCAPCRKLTHEIDSTLAGYKDRKDIQLIGVDFNETPVSNNDPIQYWKDHGYGFPMTVNDTVYGQSIGAGNPTVIVVDRAGVVRGRWDGRTAQTAGEIAGLIARLAKDSIGHVGMDGIGSTGTDSPDDLIHTTGMPVFAKITNTAIPGAPLLSEPMLITGTEREIRTEKHGLAYPAFYDWNHDGKIDLLLGEFETGQTGSDIKVFLNIGTNEKPRYTGKYFYATDVKGDTMTSYQWCCIGTHPRLVDLDQDGYVDILTGQYNPGQINWWRGSKDGFQPRQFVDQQGYQDKQLGSIMEANSDEDPNSLDYWNYTSAGFGDFNGDGLTDLFVGGFGELRVALNIGTKEHPRFGLRKYLLGIDGYPLSVVAPDEKEVEEAHKTYDKPHYSGVIKAFITPVDWDGDGVLDLLVTHLYGNSKTKDPVVFFRGVHTDKGLRFEPARPLFTAEEVRKTFPGCQPNIAVTDYNHDGVPDLVIGLSLPTVNGFTVDSLVAWHYLDDFHLEAPGKDAGRIVEWEGGLDKIKARLQKDPGMRQFVMGKMTDEKYLTLRHRGYVYVMLGRRNPQKAVARKGVIAQEEFKIPEAPKTRVGGEEGPVSYELKAPKALQKGVPGMVEVDVKFKEGWYGYANTEGNTKGGWIPTKVDFHFPDAFMPIGGSLIPDAHFKGGAMVYSGDSVPFRQQFMTNWRTKGGGAPVPGEYTIGVTIQYQTCNEEKCLPPVTRNLEVKVELEPKGDGNTFHISGHVENLQTTRVYLIYVNDNKQIMDSATVVDGAYTFTGEIEESGPAELLDVAPRDRPASRDIAKFFLAPESFVIHQVDSFSNAVVTGSVANTDYQAITAAEKPYEQREMAMLPAYQAAREAKDAAAAKSIEEKAKVIDRALDDSVYATFVRRHAHSPLVLYVLRQYARNEPDAAALQGLFDGLDPAVKGSVAGKVFADKLAIAAKTRVGAMAMDFTQNDTAGQPVSLSSFRGKYVLVDFWASWCGPCRAENPNVVEAYAKYHSKGFDIIGVSLDRPGDKDKWLKAIHTDKLYWTQVSDLGFWKNAVAVEYGVGAIPQNFLIDPQGKIIAKGLRGSDLEERLGEIFGEGNGGGSSAGGGSSVSPAAPQALGLDPAVRTGKLPNGLTYFIRRNTEPKNRVDLYLVNKVGSVLESEDQRGLAHFMEHMSFNGTAHFPKNDLIDYLQKSGVRFGADINAYTSFDETVYQLPIPSDKPDVLKNGIQIIRDWAQDATLDPVEIDKERGVVLEEKRLGKGAGERMRRVYFPVILNNSRYAERLPIGLDAVLNHFKPSTIRRFYHDWYRPDLQAVIVVGDIDVDAMERTIKEKFSDLKNPVGERARTAYKVPLTGKNHFVTVTDKEMTSTEVEVMIKHEALPLKTDADYRRNLLQELFNEMMGSRYRELTLQAEPAWVKASAGIGDFMGGLAVYDASMSARPGEVEKGVKAMWRETVRVRRFGFTQSELDRAKASYLSDIEAELKEKDKTRSENYVKEYQQYFLKGVAAPGIEKEYALVASDLPGITLAEVDALAGKYVTATNRDILVMAPQKDRAELPDSAVVTGWLRAVEGEDLQPYKDEMSTKPFLSSEPVPGSIVAEQQDTALHITRLTLSNGVKVVLKPTDFKNDQIIFSSFAPGGTSVFPDADYQSAVSAAAVVAAGGVGNYNVTELEKYLAGKQVSVRPYIGERTQGVSGSAVPKDLESALQLVYAYFTEPRKDEAVFKNIIDRSEAGLINRGNDPNSVFSDTVSAILGNYNVRRTGPTLEKLHQIDLDKAFGMYQQSFADASDQTFTFVGSFDVATIRPLLEKYLGALPATHAGVQAKDLGIHIPAGRITRMVYKGSEPKATVYLVFSGGFDYSAENRVSLDGLKEALEIRLIQRLREDESGVYSPAVRVNTGKLPESRYSFMISFGCAPENADKLVASALDEVAKLRTAGPLQENVDKWRAEDKATRETQLKTNGWWLGYINGQLENGEDLHQVDGYSSIVDSVTPAGLKAAAVKYLSGENLIRLELLPAAAQR